MVGYTTAQKGQVMDELVEQFAELLEDYSTRQVLEALAEAIEDYAEDEENPRAWARLAGEVKKLADSKTVEDTIAW